MEEEEDWDLDMSSVLAQAKSRWDGNGAAPASNPQQAPPFKKKSSSSDDDPSSDPQIDKARNLLRQKLITVGDDPSIHGHGESQPDVPVGDRRNNRDGLPANDPRRVREVPQEAPAGAEAWRKRQQERGKEREAMRARLWALHCHHTCSCALVTMLCPPWQCQTYVLSTQHVSFP